MAKLRMAKNVLILFSLMLLKPGIESFKQNHICNEVQQKITNSSCNKNVYSKGAETCNILKEITFNNSDNSHCRNDQNTKLRFEIETYLGKFSFLYGLTKMAVDNSLQNIRHLNVNEMCLSDMKTVKNGIDNNEIWAKKLLDSSGTFRSGFILGNNYWMGSKKGCESINHKLKVTLSKRYNRSMIDNLLDASSPIEVNFRMLHAKHNSPWQLEMKFLGECILHLGLCVPQSCSNKEIKTLSQHSFNQKTLQLQNIYEFQPTVINVRDLKLRAEYFNKFTVKLFILLLVIVITLSICSTYISDDQTSRASIFKRIAKCFSIKENFNRLIETDTKPSLIPVINGLRSIACFWLILPHIHWFMHYTVDNKAVYFDFGENVLYQPLTNSPILVDLFFTISGFLLAINFLQNKSQMNEIRQNDFIKNIKLFGRLLFKRYIRLSPPYYILILIVEIATSLLVDVSHFYIHERNDLIFEKYWWRSLLYIQNLFYSNDMMATWTWSLACEMQYFIVFTMILFVYAKYPKYGKIMFFSLWFIAFMMSFGVAVYHKYNSSFDVWYETLTVIYIAPSARIHPYHIGMLAAYYLHRNDGNICINKKKLPIIWIGASAIVVFCVYSSSIRDLHFILGTVGLIGQRMTFGIAVSWTIIASITGNENWFTKFLEHRWFVHINKLSYAIYLLNPIVINVVYGLRDSPSHTDVITTIAMTTAVGFIVYILAIIFTLLCDVPCNRLSDEFISRVRKLPAKDT